MSKLVIPQNYQDKFNVFDTQKAIKFAKEAFQENLGKNLNLTRVSAPLFVSSISGLNDNLSGVERPVNFDILHYNQEAEVVHSLAKWKRLALKKYDFWPGNGLYTDMNAIRRDEELDNLHSIYVDQWDWEKVIAPEQRNLDYLKKSVNQIVLALKATELQISGKYHQIQPFINTKVHFISSQQLLDKYPTLDTKAREEAICQEYGTVFIMQIGDNLSNNKPHDQRAPDYDDWSLNGDLLIWYPILQQAIELSSMGIRVDAKTLEEQLEKANCTNRVSLNFHQQLLNNKLPLTIGGGIGQSRLCLVLLQKAHIGEVQVSIWPEDTINKCKQAGINLL
ncbi:MAG: aspartate--ammonia ligase [Erysipelotrichaceae bacterium]